MKLNLTLAWLAALNLLLGLIVQWYVVTRLGLNLATDALYAGMAVPQLALAVLSGSLMHVLVPLLAGEKEDDVRKTAWTFLLGISGVFLLLGAVLFAAAPVWVGWLLPGFTAAGRALTVSLTRIQLVGMVLTASLSVLWSVYHARRRFVWAELAPVLASAAVLAALVPALPRFGVYAAAWASVARIGLQVLLLLPGLGAFCRPGFRSPDAREGWRRLRPLLIGTAFYKTDSLVDRFLSSLAPAGGLSTLYLGQQIWSAASQIVNKGVAAPMVPLLAEQAKQGRWRDFRRTVRQRTAWMLGLTGALFVLLLASGRPALRLMIGHGGVTEQNVTTLWQILAALGGVLIAGAAGQIVTTAFYAFGDTKTPTRLGVLTYLVYIPGKVLAFSWLGLIGVAAATSLYYVIGLLLQVAFLRPVVKERSRTP